MRHGPLFHAKCYIAVERSHHLHSKTHSWPTTRLPRLPSPFGVAVHVIAGRTCSSGIVRPFDDPDPLVPRQGPWHELQRSWSCHAVPKQVGKVLQNKVEVGPLLCVWDPVLASKKKNTLGLYRRFEDMGIVNLQPPGQVLKCQGH